VGEKQEDEMFSATRLEVTKVDGTGNFLLWLSRVKDLLRQH
jgi:hypothetical protein